MEGVWQSVGGLYTFTRGFLYTIAEKKIVQRIGRQHTTKDIAQMLFIPHKTVENHRTNIMKKLALRS